MTGRERFSPQQKPCKRGRLWQAGNGLNGLLRSSLTVNIALFLSSDGIALAHRQKAGHWAMIGETAFDVPDLNVPLAALRAQAVEREGDDFEALLVLPDDQILYTSLTVPTGDDELTAFRIEDGLEGLTPYSVTELEYAWEELEQDRVKIAVVARETLDEASGFAKTYGFVAKGFAAMPPMEKFPGVPTFDLGDEAAGMGFTADGIAFGADTFGQPDPEPEPVVAEPEPEPVVVEVEPDVEPTPEADAAQSDVAEDDTSQEQPAATEITEDDATPPDAPEDVAKDVAEDGAKDGSPEPEGDPEPAEDPVPEPAPENAALADALGVMAAEPHTPAAPKDTSSAPTEPVQSVTEIQDPTVAGPIQSIASADPSSEVVGDAGDDDDVLPPAPSPAARLARERARVIRGDKSRDKDAGAAPSAAEGSRVQRPAAAGPMPTRDPSGEFAATRGRVAAPDTDRDSIVGQRGSRIGLSQPDATPPRAAPTVSPDNAQPLATATPMPRLAEQLQRVRSASKTKPKGAADIQPPRARVEIDPQPQMGQTGALAERRPSPFDDPPPGAQNAGGAGLLGRLAGIRQKSGPATKPAPSEPPASGAAPEPVTASAADDGATAPRRFGLGRSTKSSAAPASNASAAADDGIFTSGMLARKATTQTGGSFKTGLILTGILLLLLILVAIWAAVFLPNSTVARWFGGTTEQVSALPPATGLQAPDVGTSAPVIGTLDGTEPSLIDEAAADGMVLPDEESVSGAIPLEDGADGTLDVAGTVTTPDVQAELPDIDAELDLPPLPPIDQGLNPSPEEAEALYAEDGIWARSPDRPDLRPFDLMDRVYTASIDPQISAFDAVALPDPGVNLGEVLRRFPPPPPFGTEFDRTATGLIAATPDGVLTPEGAFVILGQPPTGTRPRPREVTTQAPVIDVEDAVLGTFRPNARPSDLAETRERQILNGLTEAELADVRPVSRPASPQETAAQASLFPADGADPDAVDAAVREAIAGTELAIARSLLPRTRPANITQIVASADRTPIEQPTAVAANAVAAGPAIPSNADVSRAATERNAIRLRNINLIGVNGSASDRRALVRLASGRFVRVNVGDRLDGGRVAAIGETTLQYVRSGRTVTLEIPG